MDLIRSIQETSWRASFDERQQREATQALESGGLLFFPRLAFELDESERRFLDPATVHGKTKNISYDPRREDVRGSTVQGVDAFALQRMLARYATQSFELVRALLPHYVPSLEVARTSFRPAEVSGRASSWRKDDTRLHIDAFPSSPNQGKRLLRVFTNVNPGGKDRIWRVGEPFTNVAQRFLPGISRPLPGSARFLRALGITKSRRTDYDHIMLQIHDHMKSDAEYQAKVGFTELRLPPGSTWIVFSDCVSHAVLAGQFLMEQTFMLPVGGMLDPDCSPLRILERATGRPLV
ncbi:MAG TPA: Kdo hydroxylase family protein [Burkholderiaceae bacterium]|nr:Kdo hydroxylase family protein [Burkholderiaceae bacterium]